MKSASGERVIYLNDEALDALKHLFEATGNSPWVNSTKQNKPVQPSNIERMIRAVIARANIQANGRNVHALRHSFATNLFFRRIETKTISALLGHADTASTENIYIHVLDEQKKEALITIVARKESPD